jgi:hypothetical protein
MLLGAADAASSSAPPPLLTCTSLALRCVWALRPLLPPVPAQISLCLASPAATDRCFGYCKQGTSVPLRSPIGAWSALLCRCLAL